MAAASTNSSQRNALFPISIEKLFNNWQALQLAIENGQGGSYGKEIGVWMRQAVEDYFYQNEDLDSDEVSEFLGTIMDQELDTIVDDNSLDALGAALVQHFKFALAGKQSELEELFKKLDEEAAKPKPKHSRQDENGDDSSESECDEEAMDVDDNSHSQTQNEQDAGETSSHHRAGKNFVTEPDNDGWVTVTKSKKH